MHITNQKLSFNIFTVGNVLNIFMEHDPNDFWHKIKMHNFDPYSVLLSIAAHDCFCAPDSHIMNAQRGL